LSNLSLNFVNNDVFAINLFNRAVAITNIDTGDCNLIDLLQILLLQESGKGERLKVKGFLFSLTPTPITFSLTNATKSNDYSNPYDV